MDRMVAGLPSLARAIAIRSPAGGGAALLNSNRAPPPGVGCGSPARSLGRFELGVKKVGKDLEEVVSSLALVPRA